MGDLADSCRLAVLEYDACVSSTDEVAAPYFITGHVTDEAGRALMYVKVQVVDTDLQVNTDVEGNFRMEAPTPCVDLVFHFPWYESATVSKICHNAPAGSSRFPLQRQMYRVTCTWRMHKGRFCSDSSPRLDRG
ncbi:MAG: carboxypeptidase-like regulatory domain-containing protein [Saprospiraceae bacterium]